MTNDKQLEANRLNAQHSTGPRSDEGKAVTRFNAMKHGIDARSIVIPGENAEDFTALAEAYAEQLQPEGPVEAFLVRTIIVSDWFVRRYDRIEAAVIAAAGKPVLDQFREPSGKSNPLPHIFRRRSAAQRDWMRAFAQLCKLQKARQAAAELKEPKAAAPQNGSVPQPQPMTAQRTVPAAVPPAKLAS
jgi:hypothetical protein